MMPAYNDNINLTYDNFKKLKNYTYTYKIYFYNGEEENENGNAKTTENSFPVTMIDGTKIEREAYALKIKKIIDSVFNSIDIGVKLEYDGWEDFDSAVFIKNKGEGSITIFNHQGAVALFYPDSWGIKLSLISNENSLKGTVVHELQHCLGLLHTRGRTGSSRYSEDKTIKYGNPYFEFMPFSYGDGLCPESLNSLDIIYDNDVALKITGNINNYYLDSYYDGYAEAFIIRSFNSDRGKIIHHAPIDGNGYFEFRLRTIPNFKARYRLLTISSGINYNFVNSIYDKGKEWIDVNYPGKILSYGIHPIKILNKPVTVKQSEFDMKDIGMSRKTNTIKKLSKENNIVMMKSDYFKMDK